MEHAHRNLILAAEIQGLIHDLGKLRPEFAQEKSAEGESLIKSVPNALQFEAHGAILETARAYPPAGEDVWLQQIQQHPDWAAVLRLPEDWIQLGTVQALGLGDALRMHHANNDFPPPELSLLGDLYTFGADGRDSALDKGSGQTLHGEQRLGHAYRADSFGNETEPFDPALLEKLWGEARTVVQEVLLSKDAWEATRIPKTCDRFRDRIQPILRQALGETRRPTNDVSLWHHSHSAASLFKAAVAEGVLRRDFRHLQRTDGDGLLLGRVQFRLLGIRWDWASLIQGALRPVVFAALQAQRQDAVTQLKALLESEHPIGNVIYEDDDGVVLVTPGFFEPEDADGQSAEQLYREQILDPLLPGILNALAPLGPGTAVRIAWTAPALYLTDYPEVLAVQPRGTAREWLRQVGETEFRELWAQQTEHRSIQICPQCGLRPALARELALTESQLDETDLCIDCKKLASDEALENRWQRAKDWFGVWPRTFNLQELRQARGPDNPRLALISVRVDAAAIASGEVLLTQLARPFAEVKLREETHKAGAVKHPSVGEAGNFLEQVIGVLAQSPSRNALNRLLPEGQPDLARDYAGDKYWITGGDGRIEGPKAEFAHKAHMLLNAFFFRESVPENYGVCRHDGDRLLLFGMRKHASPGRLARLWDDLRELWKSLLADIDHATNGYMVPVSLDARGARFLVAAADARKTLDILNEGLNQAFSKVRAGLPPHISALVFREKFPLYLALDGLRRMEGRIGSLPIQEWTLRERREDGTQLHLTWQTPQGQISWTVDLGTGDPDRYDLWYPHAVCISRAQGPERLVHLRNLQVKETIALRPATFDFAVLEGSTRRYSLRYEPRRISDTSSAELLYRPHFILGDSGRPPYLLEQMPELLGFVGETGWNASQLGAILGQIIECYEKWVRDAPPALRMDGRRAWHIHTQAILRRNLPGNEQADLRAWMQAHLDDGGLFDAFEWAGFVEKKASISVTNKRQYG